MDHEEIKQLLPLHAIDQLGPDEASIVEDHARTCDDCAAELQAYRAAAAAIPMADEPAAPNHRIWARLEARLTAEGQATSSDPSSRPAATTTNGTERPPAARINGWRAATGFAAAAAILIAVYAGLLSSKLDQQNVAVRAQVSLLKAQIADLRSAVSEARVQMAIMQNRLANRDRLQRVLLTPDVTLTRLGPLPVAPKASAIVAVSSSSRAAALEARGLPPTPQGKVYELWWITKENGPTPAGVFNTTGSGSITAAVAPPPAGQHVLLSAVTLEPIPGVSKPTGAMFLKGAPG